ncbi:D-isomer specific 2-hydroxyacid dehydrogenase [Circinella umbellata]|nr:D-isomer specific 2-hydroxyacid dehydrogenase [Circinella umbellata]
MAFRSAIRNNIALRGVFQQQYSLFHSNARVLAPKVVATRVLPQHAQARLKEQDFELVQWPEDSIMPRDKLLSDIKGAEGLLCVLGDKIDKELLEAAGPNLKVVTTMSVGYDHIDLATAKKNNVKVGYTPDVLTDATADLTVLLTLAAARKMKQGIRAAENGEWREWRPNWLCGYQFAGKTLGMVGMGRIGQAVANRLRAFGVDRVLYWGRSEKPELKGQAEFASMDQLLKESDYVVACCALTPETKELFDYDAFKKMKDTAIFANSARGAVVKQEDLVRALQENLIAGAGLDVTTPEPLPTDHPLFKLDNCVILPHIGSATIEAREVMGDICIDNITSGLKNEKLRCELNY